MGEDEGGTEDLLLRQGRALQSDGTLEPLDIRITAGVIAEVGPELAVAAGSRVVDLSGSVVLPGLVDAHTHLAHGYAASVSDREAAQGLRGSFQGLRALRAGITSVRELGCYRQVDLVLRDAIADGRVLGPRMLCAGTYLTITGGHGHPKGRAADGPVEVRKAVREQLLAGADLIKVMCSGGAARADESPDASQFTFEEIQAAVDEAALAGRVVAAHAHPTRSIKWALQAGARSIEHGTFIDQECEELFVEKDAFLVPTLNVYRQIAHSDEWPELKERARELYDHKVRTFVSAVEHGVKWAVGSDTSMFLPIEEYWQELATIADVLSLKPAEMLVHATETNADLLGLDRLGRIAPGQLADLVVLSSDPTEDLAALSEVRYTVARGRLIDWEAIDDAFGPRWFARS